MTALQNTIRAAGFSLRGLKATLTLPNVGRRAG